MITPEQLAPIMHKVLFNRLPKKIHNPNKPENIPRLKAEKSKKESDLKMFWEGSGKVLFEKWQEEITNSVIDIFSRVDDCNCKTSLKVKNVKAKIELIAEAQLILNKE